MAAVYVAILKGKQGELKALSRTKKSLKEKFIPLIEIPPVPLKYVDGSDDPVPAKEIDSHIKDSHEKLISALRDYEMVFVDGLYVEDEPALKSGIEPSREVFAQLQAAAIPFCPVVGLDRVGEYIACVSETIEASGNGCVLRITFGDLDTPPKELKVAIESLLRELKVSTGEVDLLVDFGPEVPAKSALLYQLNALPYLNQWRSLIAASCSFPPDMSDVAQNSLVEVERKEWTAWSYLRNNKESVTRMPIFGDYGINHPIPSDIDPRMMRISPNIRYTAKLNYVIAKGSAYPRKSDKTKKQGVKAADQYPKLAKLIMEHKSWKGEKFSWGDGFIAACSRKECVGNTTDWRAVGTAHHIASVVQQLSSLHEDE